MAKENKEPQKSSATLTAAEQEELNKLEAEEKAAAEAAAKADTDADADAEVKKSQTTVSGLAVSGAPPVGPDKLADQGPTVTMMFPRKVNLQDKPGLIIQFPAGVCEVPERLADHPYLKAHGVQKYVAKKK